MYFRVRDSLHDIDDHLAISGSAVGVNYNTVKVYRSLKSSYYSTRPEIKTPRILHISQWNIRVWLAHHEG